MKQGHGWPDLRSILRQYLARLPQFCFFCHQKTDTGYDLCRYCQSHLPTIVARSTQKGPSSVCLRCGFVWLDSTWRKECAHCVNYRTGFGQVISPYRYDFPIDGIIQRLKYQDYLPSGRLLGNLLAREVINQDVDLITQLKLHVGVVKPWASLLCRTALIGASTRAHWSACHALSAVCA